jgi:D-beta-D-heptose 7-phosphate kinase/D-beta-D-heptose 1-phosphate adenosyltransferase
MNKVVLTTGGCDPLHSGHIKYFTAAKELGDHLVVGINSNEWLTRKKGRPFMSFEDRAAIVKELSCVDEVIAFDDTDNTACAAIAQILQTKGSQWQLIFANGGDRKKTNTPEYQIYGQHPDVKFAWGIGGTTKKNSSSWILEEWKTQKTERSWGWYRVLDHQPQNNFKVKELVIEPGKSLSDQRHSKRNEHWYVLKGTVKMQTERKGNKSTVLLPSLNAGYDIELGTWHCASNPSDTECAHVLEVQYGEECEENDIERRNK